MGRKYPYKTYTIRLRENNRRENAIMSVIEGVSLNEDRSLNQFLIDAVEYYLANMDESGYINSTENSSKNRYVLQCELESELAGVRREMQELKQEISMDVYEKMLSVLLSNAMNPTSVMVDNQRNLDNQDNLVSHVEEEDDSLIEDVMKWS
ncbi:MAG: hypothetical protein Q4F06_02460 [Eubacteriales bacterium]|nr:hypothetical protein [Eubacteriales bacterium]